MSKLYRGKHFKQAVPQSWWDRVRTNVMTAVGLPVALASSLFMATPAYAEGNEIVDTTDQYSYTQVDNTTPASTEGTVEEVTNVQETTPASTEGATEETTNVQETTPASTEGATEEVTNEQENTPATAEGATEEEASKSDEGQEQAFKLTGIRGTGKTVTSLSVYEYLLQHSGENCEENYKKCGILDTSGNIMCIPKEVNV